MTTQHNWKIDLPECAYPRGERVAVWCDGAGRYFFTVNDRSHSLDDWRSTVLAEIIRLAADYDALQKEVDGFCRTLGEENVVSAMVKLLALQKERDQLAHGSGFAEAGWEFWKERAERAERELAEAYGAIQYAEQLIIPVNSDFLWRTMPAVVRAMGRKEEE